MGKGKDVYGIDGEKHDPIILTNKVLLLAALVLRQNKTYCENALNPLKLQVFRGCVANAEQNNQPAAVLDSLCDISSHAKSHFVVLLREEIVLHIKCFVSGSHIESCLFCNDCLMPQDTGSNSSGSRNSSVDNYVRSPIFGNLSLTTSPVPSIIAPARKEWVVYSCPPTGVFSNKNNNSPKSSPSKHSMGSSSSSPWQVLAASSPAGLSTLSQLCGDAPCCSCCMVNNERAAAHFRRDHDHHSHNRNSMYNVNHQLRPMSMPANKPIPAHGPCLCCLPMCVVSKCADIETVSETDDPLPSPGPSHRPALRRASTDPAQYGQRLGLSTPATTSPTGAAASVNVSPPYPPVNASLTPSPPPNRVRGTSSEKIVQKSRYERMTSAMTSALRRNVNGGSRSNHSPNSGGNSSGSSGNSSVRTSRQTSRNSSRSSQGSRPSPPRSSMSSWLSATSTPRRKRSAGMDGDASRTALSFGQNGADSDDDVDSDDDMDYIPMVTNLDTGEVIVMEYSSDTNVGATVTGMPSSGFGSYSHSPTQTAPIISVEAHSHPPPVDPSTNRASISPTRTRSSVVSDIISPHLIFGSNSPK